MSILDRPSTELRTVKYYRSFDGYSVPFIPLNEVPFDKTADLKTFYSGQFDSRQRLVKFVKISLQRGGAFSFRLEGKRRPGEQLYFRSLAAVPTEQAVATPISYSETEGLYEYYAGKVGDDCMTGEAHLISRVTFFEDAYEYRSDGTPSLRVLTREDGSHITEDLTTNQIAARDELLDVAKDRLDALTSPGARPESYLDSLGVGDFESRWGQFRGAGQSICILDSGVDESHPCLQGAILDFVRFDQAGQLVETYAAADYDPSGHGTLIAGLIAGREISRRDLGLTGARKVRQGILPEAKIVSISILGGSEGRRGTLIQLLAGLDWAAENRERLGFDIVVIGLELCRELSPSFQKQFDLVIDLFQHRGLVVILPAGNHRSGSFAVGTRGVYVGASDLHGRPWQANGPRVDLLAPGVDLLCCNPSAQQLGPRLGIELSSGTSLSAAVVAGCTALLAQASGRSAAEALKSLLATTGENEVISLDRAWQWLQSNSEGARIIATSPAEDFDEQEFAKTFEMLRGEFKDEAVLVPATLPL